MTGEFNNLLEEDLAGRSLSVGQIVDGTVVQISEDGVFVDIGAKSEGHLELDQILQEELARLQVGDPLKVRIIKKVDGEYKLSKKSVDFELAWNKLTEDKDNDREVEIKILEKVKNGYTCEAYGVIEGFVHHTNFKGRPALGQPYKARILDLNRKMRKLVFTRRDILERERLEALDRDFAVLQEGMVVEGVVDKLSQYGAFVKITDHLTGLLHISEFSFEHVKKPSEVLKPGDVVPVKILQIDREKNKISLSRKATMRDPLMILLPGEEMDGTVESLADFGAFVRLKNGITGLVHISELSHRKFAHPSEILRPGDDVRVKVLKVQVEERRVSLSAKACERDPWSEVYSRYMAGQAVTGVVLQLMQSGLVIKLDELFEAFVPISEISEERIKHPGDVHREGDEVAGVILTIDRDKRRIRVSLRRKEQAFDEATVRHHAGPGEGGDEARITAGKVTLGDILGGKLDLTAVAKRERTPQAEAPAPPEPPAPTVVSEVAPEDVLAAAEPAAEVEEPADAAVEPVAAVSEPEEGAATPESEAGGPAEAATGPEPVVQAEAPEALAAEAAEVAGATEVEALPAEPATLPGEHADEPGGDCEHKAEQ
jgi:small subunit ribosomal protein S1